MASGAHRLVELGAGTGHDSEYFRDRGLSVVATDLSIGMARRCLAKGIMTVVMDLRRPCFGPGSFDAIWAINCLLHVPNVVLPSTLTALRSVLRPGGLFFLGVYGGRSWEGPLDSDPLDPPRFFSSRSDEELLGFVRPGFEVIDFHAIDAGAARFQSLTLRRPHHD